MGGHPRVGRQLILGNRHGRDAEPRPAGRESVLVGQATGSPRQSRTSSAAKGMNGQATGPRPHQIEAGVDDGAGAFAVCPDHGPGRRLAEIGVRELPDRAHFLGGLAEGERFVVGAQPREVSIEVRGELAVPADLARRAGGTVESKRLAAKDRQRLTRLPKTSARSLFTPSTKRSTVKSVSPPSGALAASHQRQVSAGQQSSAVSVKMPRCRLVENLPPSKVSQLKPLMTSTSLNGRPEPSSVAGKLMAWNGTLSLARNCR